MAEVVDTAGLTSGPNQRDFRKEAISVIRTTLRKQDASDDEVDGALEALLELAKGE